MRIRTLRTVAVLTLAAALAACSGMGGKSPSSSAAGGGGTTLKLSGSEEVPPVTTSASGTGSITVAADGSVSGSVKTTGLNGTAAHIHSGAKGANGPVVVPLVKTGDNEWSVPPGAKLTPEQLAAYKAGALYVNVHTEANKGGEVRAQLQP
ncbi:MAG TPA: CHRD domain-containing protein [Albitalea sp.]